MFNHVFGIFERSWPINSIHSISSLQNSPVALHPHLPRHPEKTSLHRINNFFGVSPKLNFDHSVLPSLGSPRHLRRSSPACLSVRRYYHFRSLIPHYRGLGTVMAAVTSQVRVVGLGHSRFGNVLLEADS